MKSHYDVLQIRLWQTLRQILFILDACRVASFLNRDASFETPPKPGAGGGNITIAWPKVKRARLQMMTFP